MELLTLSKYQERSFAETPNKRGWIDYGEDNLFPQYLVDLYQTSPTHNALATSIAYMIYGDGPQGQDTESKLKIEELGLDDTLRKACLDLKIQGGFALEVTYSLDRTTVARVNHVPFQNLRAEEVTEAGVVEMFQHSTDWSDLKKNPPERVCAFNPSERIDHPRQILYVKPFSPGSVYYPKPDYIGSVNYIELEKEISRYHINNIQNGLAPSFTIHFKNGVPSPEERHTIRRNIERQLAGATNAGKFIVTYSDTPDRKPDFEPFPLSDADKQYQFLSEETTNKVMVGHRVTSPMLFGLSVPGKLGGGPEMEQAEAIFMKNVVEPFQLIVRTALSQVLRVAGVNPNVTLVKEETTQETLSKTLLDGFVSLGEDDPDDGWELIDETPVDYETDHIAHGRVEFAKRVPGDAGRPSEIDNDLVRIRYRYDGDPITPNSREFCKKMLSGGRSKLYRKEDIMNAGNVAVNPGFGPGGDDTYSIWLYKGGVNCHHRWIRNVYLRKGNKKISVAEARRLINQIDDPAVRKRNQIKSEDGRVSQKPIDMPRRGAYS